MSNIKNIWRGLTFFLRIKSISTNIPKSLFVNDTLVSIQIISTASSLKLLTEPSLIFPFHINIFPIFVKTDLMSPFLRPTDKREIDNFKSSLSSNKLAGPNSYQNIKNI